LIRPERVKSALSLIGFEWAMAARRYTLFEGWACAANEGECGHRGLDVLSGVSDEEEPHGRGDDDQQEDHDDHGRGPAAPSTATAPPIAPTPEAASTPEARTAEANAHAGPRPTAALCVLYPVSSSTVRAAAAL